MKIALIGFGEAGRRIGASLVAEVGQQVAAYDLLHREKSMQDAARAAKVDLRHSSRAAVEGADIVFSFVTASSAIDAASEASQYLNTGQLYIDCNSVSPATKRKAGEPVTASGAAYAEAAVMAPVPSVSAHKVPILLAGNNSGSIATLLNTLGMNVESAGSRIGDASLNKMIRSIFIKGFEALLLEGLVAAYRAGLTGKILDSVQQTIPGVNWREAASYYLERTATHGARRAAEMKESAATVAELGLDPFVTAGIAARIEWAHELLKDAEWPDGAPKDYEEVLAIIETKFFAGRESEAAE